MKALVISHAHPDFSVGGAEIAAYNLYECLKDFEQLSEVSFLARTDFSSLAPGSITTRRENEFLWRQDIGDWFRLRTAYPKSMSVSFRHFLLEKRPNIIFVHHYSHIGVEMLEEIRVTLPESCLVLTLHEYGAICHRQGQMLKNRTDRLCNRESLEDCHLCFEEKTPEDFWLRKHYITKHFGFVDHFISPSHFLRRRYVDWGIPAERISVIENGQPTFTRTTSTPSGGPLKIGYFGQVNRYKGLDVLLRAVGLVPEESRVRLQFEIHGANLSGQEDAFRTRIADLCQPLIEEGRLHWVGPYERSEMMRRMSKVDWLVVPSIWWENSPMVIQEAFSCGKPVLCSGIGGMAEKVRDGFNGLHFEASNPLDLAEKLCLIADSDDLTARLARNVTQPVTYEESAKEYLGAALEVMRAHA